MSDDELFRSDDAPSSDEDMRDQPLVAARAASRPRAAAAAAATADTPPPQPIGQGLSSSRSPPATNKLSLTYDFVSELAPGSEEPLACTDGSRGHLPEMHFYLSAGARTGAYDRDVVVHDALRVDGHAGKATLHASSSDALERALLCVDLYAWSLNDWGSWCRRHVGAATLPVAALGSTPLDVALLHPTDEAYEKSRVRLTRPGSKATSRADSHDAAFAELESVASRYTERSMNDFVKGIVKPIVADLEQIHAPLYTMRTHDLPGGAYVLPRACEPPVETYYLNALDIVLKRHGMTRDDFVSRVDAQFAAPDTAHPRFRKALAVAGEMCTVFSNALPYIGDYDDRNRRDKTYSGDKVVSIEQFSLCRVRHSGDCEDLGKENDLAFGEMRYVGAELEGHEWSDGALRAAKRVLELYFNVLPLGAVSAPSARHDQDKQTGSAAANEEELGAHIWGQLIPRAWMHEMLAIGQKRVAPRADVDDALLQRMLSALKPADGFAPFERTLDLLNLEGTGRVSVLQRALPDFVAAGGSAARREIAALVQSETDVKRALLKAAPALRDLRMDLKQYALERRNLSSFYRIVVSGFTDYFVRRGVPVVDVVFLTGNRYGVAYSDLVYRAQDDDERVAAYVPAALRADELAACRRLLELNHPVPALAPPRTSALHPLLQRVADTTPKPSGEHAGFVDFYADYDTVTPRIAEGVRAALNKSPATALACIAENITPAVASSIVRFYYGA